MSAQQQLRRLSVRDIQRATAYYYNVELADMLSARRDKAVVRPRMVAMYLAREFTQLSYPLLAEEFAKRNHGTVMHSVKRICELMAEDPHLDEDVKILRSALSASRRAENGR